MDNTGTHIILDSTDSDSEDEDKILEEIRQLKERVWTAIQEKEARDRRERRERKEKHRAKRDDLRRQLAELEAANRETEDSGMVRVGSMSGEIQTSTYSGMFTLHNLLLYSCSRW